MATMEKLSGIAQAGRAQLMRRVSVVMERPGVQGVARSLRFIFAPVIAVGSGYSALAAQAPFTTGFITTGVKTTAADAFAQLVVEGKEKIDWKRNAMFTTFGFFYLGGFQYWLYNVQFTKWCSTITKYAGHAGAAPVKTFIDQFLHHPLMYFPVFYSLKATVEGRPIMTGPDSAVARYRAECFDCWKACWSLWVPCTLFNFTFVPRHLRIPFVAATSFVWTITLSCMQGAFTEEKNGAAVSVSPGTTEQLRSHKSTYYQAQGGTVDGIVAASTLENRNAFMLENCAAMEDKEESSQR